MNLTKRTMLLPVASLLLLGGCAQPPAYKEPISTFQKASAVVIEGVRNEYYAVNKREREALIDSSVAKEKVIDITLLDQTRLLKPDDFKARMDALSALEKHGKLLFELASSATSSEAKDAVNSLDDAILRLKGSLGKSSPDNGFKDKAGAFTTIAGEVTKLVLNAKVDEALRKAITLSENDVSEIISLIENEMITFRYSQKIILFNYRLLVIEEYNKEISKNPPDKYKIEKVVEKLKNAENAWENIAFIPQPSLQKMNDAHKALVKYAKKEHKSDDDLSRLVSAMEAFAEQAKIVADAIKTMQQ